MPVNRVIFSEDVPEKAREGLARLIQRAYEVGIPCKSLVTCKPDAPAARTLLPEWRIIYGFKPDEAGNIYVSVLTEE